MTKKVSAILFVTTLLFVLSTFTMSSIHSHELNADVFGYPFVFFTSNLSATETSFSLLALLGNITMYSIIAYVFVQAIEKLKELGNRNKFKTYP
jgi:hypothetical protein